MRSSGRARSLRAVLIAVVLVSSACGMRVDKEAIVAAASGGGTGTQGESGDLAGVTDAGGDTGASLGSGDAGAATGASGGATGGKAASTGTGSGSSGGSAGQAAKGSGAPLKIASVGTLSGPAGATLITSVRGLQGWVRYINDKGGLNGHPVQLTVADDGGDSAKHRSMLQDLVENKGVVAFVNNTEALTGGNSAAYLESKRVPVIGTDTGTAATNTSPMYFPQASSGSNLILAAAGGPAQQAAVKGMKKAGILSCTEAQICRDLTNNGPAVIEHYGMQVVYSGQASLAQPDFTAECLNAKSAGVELLEMSMDTNSVARIARSCAQQGYRPQFGFGASIIVDSQAADPNLDGHVLGDTNVFAWFQTNTPATQEFQAAAKKYGLVLGVGAATGWTSGKLLEKAAANLAEPTSEAILKGLWSIKNDNLDGLTTALTFTEGKTAQTGACWFNIATGGGKWSSPDGFKLSCY